MLYRVQGANMSTTNDILEHGKKSILNHYHRGDRSIWLYQYKLHDEKIYEVKLSDTDETNISTSFDFIERSYLNFEFIIMNDISLEEYDKILDNQFAYLYESSTG